MSKEMKTRALELFVPAAPLSEGDSMTSVSEVIVRQSANASSADIQARREHRFFIGMAVAMALVCFAGFAPSYYLKAHFGTPPLKPLLHLHGFAFTMWMLLLVVQVSLVAVGRTRLHRQLGAAGGVLAVLLVATGAAAIFGRATTVTPGLPHEMILRFMAISVTVLVVFPTLIALALCLRRNAAAHKRLMLLATTIMLMAAVHRLLMWLIDPAVSLPVIFGATDLFIVALGAYDLMSRGRVHAATLWGGLLVITSQVASLMLAGSNMWLAFAHWATGT